MSGEEGELERQNLEHFFPLVAADLKRIALVHQIVEVALHFDGLEGPSAVQVVVKLKPSDPDLDQRLFPDGLLLVLRCDRQSPPKNQETPAQDRGTPASETGPISKAGENQSVDHEVEGGYLSNAQVKGIPGAIGEVLSDLYKIALSKDIKGGGYRALQKVDRSLNKVLEYFKINEKEIYRQFYESQIGTLPEWTEEEQKKLEDALIWYKLETDIKVKWSKIAKFVQRPVKDCVQRFKQCREAILKQKTDETSNVAATIGEKEISKQEGEGAAPLTSPSIQSAESSSSDEEEEEDKESPPPSSAAVSSSVEAAQALLKNSSVRIPIELTGLTTKSISLLQFKGGRFVVKCEGCGHRIDTHKCIDRGTEGKPTPDPPPLPMSIQKCSNCSKESTLAVQPRLVLTAASRHVICDVAIANATLIDLLHLRFLSECQKCNHSLSLQDLNRTQPRKTRCHFCSEALWFELEDILFAGSKSLEGLRKAKVPKEHFKLGSALPDNGTCKHYRKSQRWLRFPCCGQAFPCDICHDDAVDHIAEWATRMICGLCSKEQPYSQNCKACEQSTVMRRSAHWEGGKGCRDSTTMSRKDSKKYKIISKAKRS